MLYKDRIKLIKSKAKLYFLMKKTIFPLVFRSLPSFDRWWLEATLLALVISTGDFSRRLLDPQA